MHAGQAQRVTKSPYSTETMLAIPQIYTNIVEKKKHLTHKPGLIASVLAFWLLPCLLGFRSDHILTSWKHPGVKNEAEFGTKSESVPTDIKRPTFSGLINIDKVCLPVLLNLSSYAFVAFMH